MSAACSIAGCVSAEGIDVGKHEFGIEELVDDSEARSFNRGSRSVEDLVLIGRVSAFREFSPDNIQKFYKTYVEFSDRVHPDEGPVYSESDFREQIAGWTKLKVFSIPMVAGLYEYALVPTEMHSDVRFPSFFETWMVQKPGDLVVAKSNRDAYFIIARVLCENDKAYKECAREYRGGLYDAETGHELSTKSLEQKKSGHRIDIKDYHVLED